MLQKLVDRTCTLAEVREKAMAFRAMEVIKGAFVRTTNSSTWENAQQLFPYHTAEERLSTFVGLSFKGGLPSVFKEYCRSAMLAAGSVDSGLSTTFSSNGCTVTIVQVDSISEAGDVAQKKLPSNVYNTVTVNREIFMLQNFGVSNICARKKIMVCA